ncbi:MAG: hypothetical protein JJE48_09950, partial [Actinobacteria bacterium]|nr:hypothetical protein [Actinomycetota bacterium]
LYVIDNSHANSTVMSGGERITIELCRQWADSDRAEITVIGSNLTTPLYPEALSRGFKDPGSLEGWGEYRFSVVDNLPWLERRHRNLIRTVGLLSGFDFTAARYRSRSIIAGKRFLSIAYRFLNTSARFRWKHKLFKPAPEWRFLDWVLRLFGFWER